MWFWPIMVRNHSSSFHIKLKLNWIEQQLYASRSLQSRIWNWKIFIFPNCHTKNLSLETFKSTERGSTLMVAKTLLFKKKFRRWKISNYISKLSETCHWIQIIILLTTHWIQQPILKVQIQTFHELINQFVLILTKNPRTCKSIVKLFLIG